MASVVELMEYVAKASGLVEAQSVATHFGMNLLNVMHQLDHQVQMSRLSRDPHKDGKDFVMPKYRMLPEGRRWLEKQKA